MYYTIDDLDAVRQIDLPPMDTGAPAPHVVASERALRLEYNRFADPECSIVTVVFEHPSAHYLGYPNDEVIRGHPLYERGLCLDGFFEVVSSSWIRAMERANRIHPCHKAELYVGLSHYVITFHDSTFECVARGYSYTIRPGELV